ncbi:uncharacterized protein FFB20_15372 [Fusarium fujikuroi]|uniref:Uncharacterized protein n=2 Tax=Fusarium fujikuroi TaxID=5127 RepID=S0E255_GIBF5|nr:uncharacterized protein FFUJ_07751 [Fusarium fujikuroi IMI 58289]KLO88768.1 uncharacterized protein Y057_11550 [Fusarium fujikuroi]CCT68924.1 uncharacterized protein FFUJ_07751 [Fusarium fujikuroi IMI 58289]SCN79732.1 uncharacterized protein FFC1_03325 [Fusarium fujikuroi]SCO04100.1 uncharacterized protein FFE2_10517 [Fusarium fujikuroi]SCO07026.1 uncharacterized protein FFM5_08946 [Fusarium fujikuroi]
MSKTAECVNQKPYSESSKERITDVALHGLKSLSEQDTPISMWLRHLDDPYPYSRRANANDGMPKVKL